MKVPNNASHGSVGFNMTPMIDVVFLLIIFFLVSSHLAKQEVQMELPLPVAESGQEASDPTVPRMTINVLSDGTCSLAGRTVSINDLGTRLVERMAAEGADLEVRIRSDRAAPYRAVEPILLVCARSGIWNVVFSVYQQEDVR